MTREPGDDARNADHDSVDQLGRQARRADQAAAEIVDRLDHTLRVDT